MELVEVRTTTTLDFFNQAIQSGTPSGYILQPAMHRKTEMERKQLLDPGWVYSLPDYANHEAVFYHADEDTRCLFFVFVHNTNRGMAQGGTRLKKYQSMQELLTDGLRLSKAMTDKNAVAHLWWGGGKAIICPVDSMEFTADRRQRVFEHYGQFVARLNGVYVAAQDMNTTPEDMHTILTQNRFVTCLPRRVGGSSDPSAWTAHGVFNALRATVHFFDKKDSLEGLVVSVQGLGHVGYALAEMLLAEGAKLNVYDPREESCQRLQQKWPAVRIVSESEIYTNSCDVFAPCAIGGILNSETISRIHTRFIVGGANNQLKNPEADAQALHDRGIIYLPDFFINRMGIVNCANEQYGYLEEELERKAEEIFTDTLSLLEESREKGLSPEVIALQRASEAAKRQHPIWEDRGKKIILDLIKNWN